MGKQVFKVILAFCLGTSLYGSSFFSNNLDNDYKKFHNEIIKMFGDDFMNIPYEKIVANINMAYPKMNLFETKDLYRLEFELAGLDKKDIKVTLTDKNILTVSGTKQELTKDEKKDVVRQEQFYGSFSRSISLPDNIKRDTIKVKYDNGILKVIVQKDLTKIKEQVKTLSID